MAQQEPGIQSVGTTFDIIDSLSQMEEATLSELAEEVNLAPSTVHNHLATLESNEYVVEEDDTYRIGYRFLELGGGLRSRSQLFVYGRPKVDELADETGELVNMMVKEHGQGALIYLSKGEDAVAFDTHAGSRYYLHCNALGKAILSQLSREQVEEIIDRHGLPKRTENTITDSEELFEELSDVRDRGYAYDDEERIDGLRCVAAPIVAEDTVLGSISISGPASRIKGEQFQDEFPDRIIRTADMIGIELTYSNRSP